MTRKTAIKRDIQWSRIFAEGTAIIVSILLAFAIDTWWQDRKEADTQSAQLQSLVSEFKEARHHLVGQQERLADSLAGTVRILDLIGPDATDQASSDFRKAILKSLNIGLDTPQQATLRDVLASRNRIASENIELWSSLQTWPVLMSGLDVDGRNLERNREVNFIDALIRLDVAMLSVIGPKTDEPSPDTRLQLPSSKFTSDLTVLMHDPGIETVFTMRAIRSQVLIGLHKRAIETADEIIRYLESEN